jgi:glycosyltransferase involved in cell wall biosynthesis
MGQARTAELTQLLHQQYSELPNLELEGFIDQFSSTRFQEILAQSWILVNSALREGLPRSFLEGAAFKCAILSRVDPDGFASRFGHRVEDDDFGRGLRLLLENNAWRRKGEAAHAYVSEKYGFDAAIAQHLEAYRRLARPAALYSQPSH